MAVLKYRTSSGTYETLTNIAIKGVDPLQTSGTSTTDVMSQNAISAYLNAKADATANTAVANSVNTLSGTVTAHTADTTIHVTSNDKTNWDGKLNKSDFDTYSGATSTAIGGKLATSDFNTYSGSTDTFIKTKADSSALTEHTSNAAIHVTTDNKTNWDAAYTDKHIHENKTTLDAITSEKVTNWDTAFNKAHDHSNMSVLSAITSTDVAAWNEVSAKTNNVAYTAYTAATDTVLGNKVDKAEGMALSHNDFSDAYKNKLDAIAESAQVNTIESISIAGTAATIANKTVNLGAAAGRGVASTIASAGEDLVPSGLFYTSAGTKVVYDSNEKKIYLKNAGNTIISEIDASAFIKDGMVSNVEIKTISSGGTNVSCLVVTFNTDAEKQDINIPIGDIFDADNYYNKTQVDGIITGITASTTGLASQTITSVTQTSGVVSANYADIRITKSQVSDFPSLGTMAAENKDSYSSATQVSTALAAKANTATTYSKDDLTGNTTTVVVQKANSAKTAGDLSWSNSDTLSAITASSTAINSLTGSVGSMAFQNAASYSSASEVNTALAGKANTSVTVTGTNGLTGGGNLSANREISHATAHAATGQTTDTAQTPEFGGTFNIPVVKYDVYGHVTAVTTANVTIPSSASSWNAVTSVTSSSTNGAISVNGSEIAVHGLAGAAYLNTGTTAGTVAAGNHDHSGVYQPVGNYLTGINSTDVTTALGYTPVSTVTSSTSGGCISVNGNNVAVNSVVTSVTTSSTNGNISVNGNDVSVAGLGSAAYLNISSTDVQNWNSAYTEAPLYTYSAITGNVNSFTSPIAGGSDNNNKQAHVLFHNTGSTKVTVTVPTTYRTPDGNAIQLEIPAGGYGEVNCLVLGGFIFARAV